MIDTLLQSAPAWAWAGFHLLILLMLALDLGLPGRKAQAPTFRQAAIWSAIWIGLALAFNAAVFSAMGSQRGLEWLTGYLLEKSLSVDNLFVFVLLFGAFQVNARDQHRILHWGILGALVLRAGMILAGTALLARFGWMVWVFGAFLVVTGIRMFLAQDRPVEDPARSWVARAFRAVLPYDPEAGHERFLVRAGGRRLLTPAALVLVMVEATDLVFAVDSIPAVLAVTRDPFTVYTSNIFAILGLRSLYFLLATMMDRFRHLKTGLAVVLVYVGLKMCAAPWIHVPALLSLGVVLLILGIAVAASLRSPAR